MQLSPSSPPLWLSPVLLLIGQTVSAQQAPSAASQLLQIPQPPAAQAPKPLLPIEQAPVPAPAEGESPRVMVKSLQISGARSIAAAELVRVSGFVPGSQLTLAELRALAAKITAHYRSQGYLLAQTYLPAQDITDGAVQLMVLEGQYGQVKLNNQSRLSDSVALTQLSGLTGGAAVTTSALERRVLMLSDLPGIAVRSSLTPGSAIGTTDLVVDIQPGQAVSGALEADNQGNRYTGANRVGASINLNEPLGLGDVATARLLTSGEGLTYARVSYQLQAGPANLGVAYTAMGYTLGGEFASTQSSGTARIAGAYLGYPLVRSRQANLNLQWSVDNKDFSDRSEAGGPGSNADKNTQVSTVSLRGDSRDTVGNGFNNYLLSWSHGTIKLQNPLALALDSTSAQSNGTFDKVVYAYSRQQEISKDTGLYMSLYGQWASKNLDASEKISLGGAAGVRAYPSGEATGDEGLLVTLETRTRLRGLSDALSGQLQWLGFVDAGNVSMNKNPWDTAGPANRRMLSGAGLGLHYTHTDNWMVKATCAFKLGDEAAKSAPDAPWRFWLQINKAF